MKVLRNIGWMLMVLLLVSCSSHEESQEDVKQPAVINVYVYAPEHPLVTRGDIGEVDPINNDINESIITQLQIWIFQHGTNDLIAYYSPESVENLNNGSGETYQLSASDAFTQAMQVEQAEDRPTVDIYVVANITGETCGFTLNKETTREQLEDAIIAGEHFGLTTLTEKVPAAGLPMSGVQRDVEVGGSSPIYKIADPVKLTRMVSKIRFIFSREKPELDADDVAIKINSIQLNAEMIPTQEYLFLETGEGATPYHVGNYGENDAREFLPIVGNDPQPLTDICRNVDPMAYSYQAGQDAQEYEDLINAASEDYKNVASEEVDSRKAANLAKLEELDITGLTNDDLPLLTQVGPFYLRESGKQLSGTITFQKDAEGSEAKTVPFVMHNEGDFSRNHTWIVYAYYSVSGLVAVTVVVKNWNDATHAHSVYNW